LNLGPFWSKTRVKTKKIEKKMHFSHLFIYFFLSPRLFLSGKMKKPPI
jgi:hypothetical protein